MRECAQLQAGASLCAPGPESCRYEYLFELDSVRDTEEEIRIGTNALLHALMDPNVVVVLSLNQLTDSKALLRCFVGDQGMREDVMQLFLRHRIVVALYGNVKSLMHYLLNNFEKNIEADDPRAGFVFSALDVFKSDRFSPEVPGGRERLVVIQKAMRDSFKYNNMPSFDAPEVVSAFARIEDHRYIRLYIEALLELSIGGIGYLRGKTAEEWVSLHGLLDSAVGTLRMLGDSQSVVMADLVEMLVREVKDDTRSAFFKVLGKSRTGREGCCKQIISLAYNHVVGSNIAGFSYDERRFCNDVTALAAFGFARPHSEAAGEPKSHEPWWRWNAPDAPFDTLVRIDEYANPFGCTYQKSLDAEARIRARYKKNRRLKQGSPSRLSPSAPGSRQFFSRYLAQLLLSAFRTLLFLLLLGVVSAALGELLAVGDSDNLVVRCLLLLAAALVSDILVKIVEGALGKPSYVLFGERFRRLGRDVRVAEHYLNGKPLYLARRSGLFSRLADSLLLVGKQVVQPFRLLGRPFSQDADHEAE